MLWAGLGPGQKYIVSVCVLFEAYCQVVSVSLGRGFPEISVHNSLPDVRLRCLASNAVTAIVLGWGGACDEAIPFCYFVCATVDDIRSCE
jgi:hypothetical protein